MSDADTPTRSGSDQAMRDAESSSAREGRGGLRRRLYRRVPAVVLARRNLRRNRLRSALATLGILIGVLAIATLGIFGNVLQLSAAQSLGGFGDQVIVTPNQNAGVESLSERDIQQIRRAVGDRGEVVPMITGGALVESGSNQAFGQLYGTATPGKLFVAAEGTIPERHRQGAIVGPGIAATLDLQVGSMIDVETNSYRVIAILESPEGFSTVQPETAVVLPPGEFREESVSQVIVEASSGRAASDVATQIRSVLNPRQPRVTVFELSTVVSQINDFFGLLSAFLAGLGGISLVVAGVAILNIMLVTTVERRTEIGVMRAVGIQREDVLRLILAEATMLGVVGSILGSLFSVGLVAVLYLAVPQVELGVVLDPSNAWYLAVATGVGIVISLLSGVYPAYRAATERPVDALRG